MKITIRPSGRKGFFLWFPTCLFLNALTAFTLSRILRRKAGRVVLTAKQLRRIFRAVRKERKRLDASWQLVSVTTRDDTHISVVP